MSIKERFFASQEPLFLLDASAFIYRGFYAYSSMQRKDGFPTSAIYNVLRVLLKIMRIEKPKYFAFILDGPTKSFRYDIFPQYKQNRSKTPEHLVAQIEPLLHIAKALGLPIFISENAEADDYIASLSQQYNQEGIVIVGVDKDLRQCLTPHVILWDPSSKDEKIVTYDSFIEETGLLPHQWADFQAIIGDSSDNIPGVKGIGEKTACKIFAQYKTLEEIEHNISSLDAKIQTKLIPEMKNMYIYRELTRLSTTCCVVEKEALEVKPPHADLMNYIEEYELFSLRKDINELYKVYSVTHLHNTGGDIEEREDAQLSLFDAERTTENTILQDAPLASLHALPKAESIALYREEEILYIHVANTTYKVVDYTEQEVYDYLKNIDVCYTINVKSLLRSLPALLGCTIAWRDIAIMAYLLQPEEREYSLQRIYAIWKESIDGAPSDRVNFIIHSAQYFLEQLHATGLYELYSNIEQPLCSILASIECEGIGLDIEALQRLLTSVQQDIEREEGLIYQLAGKEFNIRSSQQLGNILFKELGLAHKSKTKTGHFSTSQEMLEKIAHSHPIIQHILKFRTLEKLRSTYLEPLPKYADEQNRIHTTLNQLVTATGRLSSSNPNLQNIPIRGLFGQPIRNCFCASSGNKLIVIDYSQIELRILAYLSEEEYLVEAFANNEDIHRRTASILYDISLDEVTKEQRRNAKAINFGLLYGMGATKLAREIGVSITQAKEFINTYFERLGKVKQLHMSIIEGAKANGYVSTLFGRRRYLPDIQSANEQMAAQARRQAVNTVIQGTAADVIKKAMVDIAVNPVYTQYNAKLILQIHDELIMEAPEEYAYDVAQHMIADMTNIVWQNITIPLTVEYGIAYTWGEAH